MNQRGSEPMEGIRIRIPREIVEELKEISAMAGVTMSEYVRLSIEYVLENKIKLAEKKHSEISECFPLLKRTSTVYV